MFDNDKTWGAQTALSLFATAPTVEYGIALAAEFIARVNKEMTDTAGDNQKAAGEFWGHVFAVVADVTGQSDVFDEQFAKARYQK